MNKELLERTLKWARTEHEARLAGEACSWYQPRWARGLRRTAEVIRARTHPDSWGWVPYADSEARDWAVMEIDCGTAFCVAGHVAALSGDQFIQPVEAGIRAGEATFVRTPEGDVQTVAVRARQLLGISEIEATHLFDACNSWEAVLEEAHTIARRYGEELSL